MMPAQEVDSLLVGSAAPACGLDSVAVDIPTTASKSAIKTDSVSVAAPEASLESAEWTGGTEAHESNVGFVRLLDKALNIRDDVFTVDSTYMERPSQTMKFRVSGNCSGAKIDTRGVMNGSDIRMRTSADLKTTMSFNYSYRGLGIGFSVNPAKIFGKKTSTEFNMGLYWNRCGIEAIYQSSGTFTGETEVDGRISDIPAGILSQNLIQVNAYYSFNAKRFSYPAAFTQSWIQKRNAGSVLAGVSYSRGNLDASANDDAGIRPMSLSMSYASLGVGYGYNFVIQKKWLMHISSIPQIVFYSRNRLTIEEMTRKAPYKFPDLVIVGRIAFVRHFNKMFLGLSGVVTLSDFGDKDQMQVMNMRWTGKAFVGVKFK